MTPIKIFKQDQLGMAVSGRELYGLIVESNATRNIFSDWFRHKQRKLGLVEKTDFVVSSVYLPDTGTNRAQIEFIITLDAAKRLAAEATKKRGLGVIAYIRDYERTGQIPVVASEPAPLPVSASTGSQLTMGTLTLKPEQVMSEAKDREPQPQTGLPLSPSNQLLLQAKQLIQQAEQLAAEEARKVEQEQQAKQEPTPADVSVFEHRLNSVELKLNTILSLFQQTTQSLQGLSPVGAESIAEEPPVQVIPTTRMLLVRLVNSYAAASRSTEHDTWKYLYGQFDLREGVNAYWQAQATKVRDQSYLAVIEERGQLDTLYDLARKLLVLPALK